jgi:hypothetical protein
MTTALGTAPIEAGEGDRVDLAGLGIVWKLEGAESDGRFSVVHHPLARARSPRRCTAIRARTSTPTSSKGRLELSSATRS